MTTSQLQERIMKAEARLEAKRSTINKKLALMGRKTQQVTKNGYTLDTPYTKLDYSTFDLRCSIEILAKDIESLRKQLPEIEAMIEKYKDALKNENNKEKLFATFPSILLDMEKELVEKWDTWDIERTQYLKGQYELLGRKEFLQKYKSAGYQTMQDTEVLIHNRNLKAAHDAVLDLYNRVAEITGDVTDWAGIRGAGVALNGIVIGKAGKARVETITASGPVQRLHNRTLVHSIN